jgi:hypothetical protein
MAYPFAAAEVLTAANLNAMIGAPTQNNQTGTTYTLALLDAGKTVTFSNASPVAVTVPLQSSVTWIANTQINLLNIGAGLVTIAGAGGVTINGTPLTLATSKGGSLIRTASNTWTFVPLGSGASVAGAAISDTPTGNYTDGGVTYDYWTYNASGTLNVTTAGFADVLVVGGGGAGGDRGSAFARNHGGGGAGGFVYNTGVYLPASAITVTVGAGAARKTEGGTSSTFDKIAGIGGGSGPYQDSGDFQPNRGGSGGGGAGATAVPPRTAAGGMANQGNSGGNGVNATDGAAEGGGGGGGAGAVGAVGTSLVGGAGGAGLASSITGTSVTYAGGGGGSRNSGSPGAGGSGGGGAGGTTNGTNGTANLGGGGGGAFSDNTAGTGGSGVVIVRVARPYTAVDGAASIGGTATGTYTVGAATYDYFTFNSSGTLTVNTAGFADVLVVGGGAGALLGGGGGGGVLYAASAYLSAGSMTVTIGAGGSAYGYNGISSRLGSFYGVGGGGQNYYHTDGSTSRHNGQPGGSGGGSGTTVAASQGTGLPGQGNDGGIRVSSGMGGGGGAGGVGADGSGTTGGNGGVGISNSITNTAVLYGPGGGGGGSVTGGTGGATGGGNGNTTTGATAGTANTGGGGGGGNSPGGKAGGSGVVIVRVRTA